MSSKLENMIQGSPNTASDMSPDLKSLAQGAPLSDGASDINKAVYQLILHKCSHRSRRSSTSRLPSRARSTTSFLPITPAPTFRICTSTLWTELELLAPAVPWTPARLRATLSATTSRQKFRHSFQNHVYTAAINEGPNYSDPHDTSAEVRGG